MVVNSPKAQAQKYVFLRRYTYLPGEDILHPAEKNILIWKVSNCYGHVCADKWQSMCTSLAKYLHILYWRT